MAIMNNFFSFGPVIEASHLFSFPYFTFNYLCPLLFSGDEVSNFSHWVVQIHNSLVKVYVTVQDASVATLYLMKECYLEEKTLGLKFKHRHGSKFSGDSD